MPGFTAVHIIYNPNSTGPGDKLAQKLKRALKKADPNLAVTVVQTEYAGHAEKLAYTFANESKRPLIISSSGDGGYHEIVNGLMRAQQTGAKPTAGLLPGGNANDHYTALHEANLISRITAAKTRSIDILELKAMHNGKRFTRYAHSYIGFGLTPSIGAELNKTDLNPLTEAWLVAKGLFSFRPVKIVRGTVTSLYDSIICSNIGQMSKYMTLSQRANPADGKFELTLFRRYNKTRLLRKLVKASLFSLEGSRHYTSYSFRIIHGLRVQLDGEIRSLDRNSNVTIAIRPRQLRCII